MRRPLPIICSTGALMFGCAWRCKLLIESRIRASAATFAQTDDTEHDRDKTGLSGLVGVLSLLGLAGLSRAMHRRKT